MTFHIIPYDEFRDAQAWDSFVGDAANGTFLHTRKFLSYHKRRFLDVSVIVLDKQERMQGLFPAAVDPKDEKCVISHPGATFGGLVCSINLFGSKTVEVFDQISNFYAKQGFSKLIYRPAPLIFHKVTTSDDLNALFAAGARITRSSLSAAIELTQPRKLTKGRKYMKSVASRYELCISWSLDNLDEYWRLLTECLLERYGTSPVHSLEEIRSLCDLFPDEIMLCVCTLDNQTIAGGMYFIENSVLHLQYSASNETGHKVGAMDLAIEEGISKAREIGLKWFSFGTSPSGVGSAINDALYDYKRSFGSGSVIYNEFVLDLK